MDLKKTSSRRLQIEEIKYVIVLNMHNDLVRKLVHLFSTKSGMLSHGMVLMYAYGQSAEIEFRPHRANRMIM